MEFLNCGENKNLTDYPRLSSMQKIEKMMFSPERFVDDKVQSWLLRTPTEKDAQQLSSYSNLVDMWSIRNHYIHKYSFALPSKEALNTILKYQPILEIGAGSGFWARLLQNEGCNIIPTTVDNKSWSFPKKFTVVDHLTAIGSIRKYPNIKTLFICWPPMKGKWQKEILKNFDTVIYIGEGKGGCTGSEGFHVELDKNFIEIEDVTIPQFFGIHDSLTVYKRG